MKLAFAYIDHFERFVFYKRFTSKNFDIVFFTAKLSIYIAGKKQGLKIILLRPTRVTYDFCENMDNLLCRETLLGILKKKHAKKLRNSTYEFLETLNKSLADIELFIVWNGSNVVDSVIKKWCKKNNINIMYLEISNLPRKLFVDSQGVNAASSLNFCDEEYLERLNKKTKGSYEDFLEKYMNFKSGSYIAPQAKLAGKINFKFIIDFIGEVLSITPKNQSESLLSKISNVLSRVYSSKAEISYGVEPKNNYYFLPLQLSNDSQLLLNSDIDNLEAIQIAYYLAKEKGKSLVIKPHPAEKCKKQLILYKKLANDIGFCISNSNTNSLISTSDVVITINSTVGLESLLLGKETLFLGRSFYKKLKTVDAQRAYVLGYLYDCDYFGNEIIDFDDLFRHYNFLAMV